MYNYFNYFDNYLAYPLLFPRIPNNCEKPPTLYTVLNSIVNGRKTEDFTKIRNLAKDARPFVFYFDYPLSSNINKEKFETMILNHFLMRRIGFDTFNAFLIQLDVKLNEIMPVYNKMFDSMSNWNIFNDGETIEKSGLENKTSESSNQIQTNSETGTNKIDDRRYSNTPQDRLEEIRNGEYVTEYNYDSSNTNSTDSSNTNGTSNGEENNNYSEIIRKTNGNKIEIMKEMQENIQSIYTLIFNDLDCLFYQLI